MTTSKSRVEGVFAIMDGGRTPDVPDMLKATLTGILANELENDDIEKKMGYQVADPLQYLTHTFLTAHRCTAVRHRKHHY